MVKEKFRYDVGILFISAVVLFVTGLGISQGTPEKKNPPFEIDRFIPVETCADCHSEIYEQWENSMHSLSHTDPIYNRVAKFLRQGLIDNDEIEEAESCVKCHTPVGFVSGFPTRLSDDLTKTPEIATRGIQCDYCHSATSVTKMYNNGLVLEPGHGEDDPGIKRGPRDDAQPDFHDAQYSKLHTESGICGTCHNVKHVVFGTDLETTYTEWENSPYNSPEPEKRVTCQGCHMYQRPGIPATGSTERPKNPGAATDYSDERPHIHTHYFVGANVAVPAMFGDEEKSDMARERLKNAATIDVDIDPVDKRQIHVTVSNTGAGHSIPTGLGNLRQVWVEIIARDRDGKATYEKGVLDAGSELPEDAWMFRTVLGDGKGNPVINIAKAREVLSDTRIKAGGQMRQTFDMGFVPRKGTTVTARLLYRGAPQKLLKQIPGEPIEPLPVVEMAKAKRTF